MYLSRLCEEFPGVLPSAILAERDCLPAGLLEEIIDSRNYARAYALYQQHPKATGALVQLVKETEFALRQEEFDAE